MRTWIASLTDFPRMRRLVETAAQIAECLDREGFRRPFRPCRPISTPVQCYPAD